MTHPSLTLQVFLFGHHKYKKSEYHKKFLKTDGCYVTLCAFCINKSLKTNKVSFTFCSFMQKNNVKQPDMP